MWRWLNKFRKKLTPTVMDTKTQNVKFHASTSGRLYIKEEEFFQSEKVKNIVARLLKSPIYKQLKQEGKVSSRFSAE